MIRTGHKALLGMIAAAAIVSAATLAPTMSYQGLLTNTTGAPLADGSYSVTFRLYNGSSVVWTEIQTVATKSGLFSAALGSVTPFANNFFAQNQSLSLSIQVGSGTEFAKSAVGFGAFAGFANVADSSRTAAHAGIADSVARVGAVDSSRTSHKADSAAIALYAVRADSSRASHIADSAKMAINASHATVADSVKSNTGVSISVDSLLSLNQTVASELNTALNSINILSRVPFPGMILIPGGTFLMGADSSTQTIGATNLNSDTVHQVTVSSFYMDTVDVTQSEFLSVMGTNPSSFTSNPQNPVQMVTWFDAVLYCNAKSKKDGRDTVYSYTGLGTGRYGGDTMATVAIDYTKNGYRLPTEAEWEYAAKAGTSTNYWWGNNSIDSLNKYAWNGNNSSNSTQPVAQKGKNAFGLYDMAGDVWQWCNDWYGTYSSSVQANPTGPTTGNNRADRGGSWYNGATGFRSAYRAYYGDPVFRNFGTGFRIVSRP